jgi:hypothetical protein
LSWGIILYGTPKVTSPQGVRDCVIENFRSWQCERGGIGLYACKDTQVVSAMNADTARLPPGGWSLGGILISGSSANPSENITVMGGPVGSVRFSYASSCLVCGITDDLWFEGAASNCTVFSPRHYAAPKQLAGVNNCAIMPPHIYSTNGITFHVPWLDVVGVNGWTPELRVSGVKVNVP